MFNIQVIIIYPIKKYRKKSDLMRWMKLEPIIQSEVSKKEKHQYNSREEISHVQGKRNPSKMVGVARGHQRADTLKP